MPGAAPLIQSSRSWPLATLTVQMGTSVGMIERHYSHLKVREAIEQLRRHETRKMLDSGGVIDEIYKPKSNSIYSPQVGAVNEARK